MSGNIEKERTLVDLSSYAEDNIPNYQTITSIPQENIEYLSSGLRANSCSAMFRSCLSLKLIPWNDFNIDTSQCTSMGLMFYSCSSLTDIDLSSMDTSKCTAMHSMFYGCTDLTSLNLSNFDTSKVIQMQSMFFQTINLITLDLSNFDTSKVKYMNNMFTQCYALQEIICPNGFDLSSCTTVNNMLYGFNTSYSGEPLHFKNVPRDLDFGNIGSAAVEGKHYVIDSYLD